MYTILAEVRVEGLDRFLAVFPTAGLERRTCHGSLGAEVLADAEDNDRVFVLIDWRDRAAFEAFLADPEVGPTMARGGAKGRPSFTPVTKTQDKASTPQAHKRPSQTYPVGSLRRRSLPVRSEPPAPKPIKPPHPCP
jgi:heme-degrading monooxygenase HmoA